MNKTISILIPTFNEDKNIEKICLEIFSTTSNINYNFEIVFIDNCSTDNTRRVIRDLARKDKRIKAIFNAKDFGQRNSPYYGMTQLNSDAVIFITSDFQDPIETIPLLVEKWSQGSHIVLLKKNLSEEGYLMSSIRKAHYALINFLSEVNLSKNTTGAGIYDQSIISILKKIDEPNPYLRGLIHEISDNIEYVEFVQPKRKFGKTKNNFFSLLDYSIGGIVRHSNIPIRLVTYVGFFFSFVSLCIGFFFLFYKLLFWNSFQLGVAPIVIGTFFGIGLQIFVLGVLGEYINIILTLVRKKPLVVESERINFD